MFLDSLTTAILNGLLLLALRCQFADAFCKSSYAQYSAFPPADLYCFVMGWHSFMYFTFLRFY